MKDKEKIIEIFNDCGIKDASFCSFLPLSTMLIECAAKRRIPQNAKTVIICFLPYKVKEEPPKNISRYAAVPDYHNIFGAKLMTVTEKLREYYVNQKFECFIDNSPIPEVYAAALSGLGVIGDNGLLITKKYGSFVFLGEIITDMEIDCQGEISECLHCGLCKTNCPKCDGLECLSKITQKKKELTNAEKTAILENHTVWGCDLCAEICPMNADAEITYVEEFILGYRDEYVFGEDIKGRAFEWRGEDVIRRNASLEKSPDLKSANS